MICTVDPPIARDPTVVVDAIRLVEYPTGVRGNHRVEIVHLPMRVQKRMNCGIAGEVGSPHRLSHVVDAIGSAIGSAERPQVVHLRAIVQKWMKRASVRQIGTSHHLTCLVDAVALTIGST